MQQTGPQSKHAAHGRQGGLSAIAAAQLTLLQDPELGRVLEERSVPRPVHLGRGHAFDAAL